MAGHRKLGRPTDERKALLRNQVTNLIYHGTIKTTDAKAKEVRKMAERLIAMAVKEHDNFEEVTVTAKSPKKDEEGRRIKEEKNGKKVNVYEEVEKTINRDHSSKLHARRKMLKVLYPVTEVSPNKKRQAKRVDLTEKLFNEIAPKYVDRNGGYTRIIKIGPRKGDAAEEVIIELV